MRPPDISELQQRAKAGDRRAQYLLAAALSAAGERDEADRWLHSAASLGEPDAGYTLATRHLQTSAGAGAAAALLEGAAGGGSTIAKRLLSVLHAEGLGVGRANWSRAIDFVISAARDGDPAALRETAMLLLSGDSGDAQGAALLDRAAAQDAIAAAAYVRRAILQRSNTDVQRARGLLDKLAVARYPNAEALSHSFSAQKDSGAPASHRHETAEIDWQGIIEKLSTDKSSTGALPGLPVAERLCDAPDASVFRGVFTPEECEYVVASASPRLAPSQTVDPRTGASRRDAYRTSLTATLGPVDLDLALVSFSRRLANLAGRPHQNGEFFSVLHYSPGQEYRPHFDWLPPGEDFNRGGQRVTTALLYLNADYSGGETHFLTPDIRFKGVPGDVLIFHNAAPDGSPDKSARHASLPVSRGAKWIVSKWFREKKYNF